MPCALFYRINFSQCDKKLKKIVYEFILTLSSLVYRFKAVLNGIDSIQKVLQYFRDNRKFPEVVDGYYGTLIENFEVEKTFFTAVEVTAGNR